MDGQLQFDEEALTHNVLAQKSSATQATVYYVAVYKQSESGLLYNLRLLVIQDKSFSIFYTKHFKPIHLLSEMQKKGGNPIKQKLCIINTSAEVQQNIVTITFIRENVKTKWIFRFYNEKLALSWLILYKDIHDKYIAKTIKSKSKETASNSFSNEQYASILSHNRYYQTLNPTNPILHNKQKPETYTSLRKGKKQLMIEIQDEAQKQGKLGNSKKLEDK